MLRKPVQNRRLAAVVFFKNQENLGNFFLRTETNVAGILMYIAIIFGDTRLTMHFFLYFVVLF